MPDLAEPFVYQLAVFGGVLGQETINNWYYAGPAQATDLVALGNDFITKVILPCLTFMNAAAGFSFVNVTGVKGDLAFTSVPISATGAVTSECLPPFVSWDFTLLRGGARERNGYKRIAGVSEASQANGQPTTGVLAVINAALTTMGLDLTDGTTLYVPAIRRTHINHVPQTPPKYFSVTDTQFSKIGSQNSRKFGHGR